MKKFLLPCVFLNYIPAQLSKTIAIVEELLMTFTSLGLLHKKNSLAKKSTKWKTDAKIGWSVLQPSMAPLKGAHSCYGQPPAL